MTSKSVLVTVAAFVTVLCFEIVATNVVEIFSAVPLRAIPLSPLAVSFLPAVLLDDRVPFPLTNVLFASPPVGRTCVIPVPEIPECCKSLLLDLSVKTWDASAATMKLAANRRNATQFIMKFVLDV